MKLSEIHEWTRLTTEQVEISATKLNVYTLCTVKSSALQFWSCLAAFEDFTQPPKPTSNLTVLPIRSEGLLNLLTLLALSFQAFAFRCGCCCCCWFACFSCSLGGGRAFHFSNFFQVSAGAWSASSAGLFLPCYQSLDWCQWTSEIDGATCLWCQCW